MPAPTDPETTVRVLLEAAGISPTEQEFEVFVQAYPTLRANADALYIEEIRYEEPALLFTPTPPIK